MPGVGIGIMILNNNGEVLLILRNSDRFKADSDMRLEGTWTLPAGKVRYGETIYDAAIRKVYEEVGLVIDDLEVISIADDINEFASFLTVGLITYKYDGNINLGNTLEHVDYGFFGLDDLPDNLCSPSKKIIKNFREKTIYRKRF